MRRLWLNIAILLFAIFCTDTVVGYALHYGAERFYGLNSHSEILLIGHSHLMLATDKEAIERELGVKVSKYTREGVNVIERDMMIEQYLDSGYSDSLKICLYGVDLCTFTGEGLSENAYKLFYPFMDNAMIDSYIRDNASLSDYWSHKLLHSLRFNDDGAINGALRGWIGDWSNKKSGVIDIEGYRNRLIDGNERHIDMNPELMEVFTNCVHMLTSRGIRVILVNTPTLDLLNEFEPEKFDEMTSWYENFARKDDMVEYWDFNPEYSSCHKLFYDRLHLNMDGQRVITGELVNRLKKEM